MQIKIKSTIQREESDKGERITKSLNCMKFYEDH